MKQFKLGRRAPLWTPTHHLMAARMHAALDSLGPAPAAPFDYVGAVNALVGNQWGMCLNDIWGDCTAADTAHTDMLVKANTGTWTGVPTDDQVLAFYEHFGFDPSQTVSPGNNPTDQGAVEDDVCNYLITSGFLGNKCSATTPIVTGHVDAIAIERIKWCVHLYGSCRLGVNLPNSAENQFSANLPWEVAGDLTIDGGHDVPAYHYDDNFLYCVTWGGQPSRPDGLTPITWEWLMRFCEEAHATIYPNLLMSTGQTPAGFDQAQLVADLNALAA